METVTIIVSIVELVLGILEIILFFKLWGMCNNVKGIASTLIEAPKAVTGSKYSVGQRVVVKKDESQFCVDKVKDKFIYYSEKHGKYFTEDEIEDSNEYWAKRNG